jgi:hypothetical protein
MTRELKRDPKTGKPKKHHTAYQLFAQVIMRRLRAKRPNATESDRKKTISIEWAKLPPEQKRYYHDEARRRTRRPGGLLAESRRRGDALRWAVTRIEMGEDE